MSSNARSPFESNEPTRSMSICDACVYTRCFHSHRFRLRCKIYNQSFGGVCPSESLFHGMMYHVVTRVIAYDTIKRRRRLAGVNTSIPFIAIDPCLLMERTVRGLHASATAFGCEMPFPMKPKNKSINNSYHV